jgi:prepilin-type N-terminal cleavage/methylation domain-containing protein
MSRRRRSRERGFTMVELMVALVMFSIVMGATVSLLRSQTRGYRLSGERMELAQNLRYATSTIDRVLRTTGMGVVSQQPMFIYGANDVVAFNTNYTHVNQDGCAVNINPDAPAGSYEILPQASAFTLPNTAYLYPSMTYAPGGSPCRAETIVFYFRPDSSTADVPDDFVLMQKVNAMPAELVAKNLMAYPGRPFFQYLVHPLSLVVPPAARDSNVIAGLAGSGINLPIIHSVAIHGSLPDTALDPSNSYLADSVKAVRINLRVSNGLTGAQRRTQDVSTVVSLPNNGLAQLRDCGSSPLLNGVLNVTPNAAGNPPSIRLQWTASFDETGGETDVNQYNIYRREMAGPAFGSALMTIPAGQPSPYVFVDDGVDPGVAYQYAVGAQDCTPIESTRLVSGAVVPN